MGTKYAALVTTTLLLGISGVASAQDGTYELRLSTAQALTPGLPGFLSATSPGIGYNLDAKLLSLNLAGGIGYFFTDAVSAGIDLSFTYLNAEESSAYVFAFTPYAKYVSNMKDKGLGFFAEPALGIGVVGGGDDTFKYFTAGAWGGLHAFVSPSIAVLAGPYVSYLRFLEDGVGDKDSVQLGLRFGLSAYLF
ncbi:MAG: hypothetical protein KC933_01715 [Myxococcales bacterium]|nr:hypothetical protein [Myxococcales bacterium]MCB9646049.1 hypothetical protein [Deltaproteobacteria bacterium]